MKSMRVISCLTTLVVGIALSASAATVVVTDENGAPIANGVLTVSPLDGPAFSSDLAPAVQATALRNGSYTVNGVSGLAAMEFEHPSYGVLHVKGDFSANGTVELVVERGQDGYSIRRAGDVVTAAPGRANRNTCPGAETILWSSITMAGGVTLTGRTASGDDSVACANNGSDYHFSFVAGATGTIDVTTCLAGNAGLDTQISVRAGCGGTVLGCNDDSCAGPGTVFNSTLTGVSVTSGQTYIVTVDNWLDTADMTFDLRISNFLPEFILAPPAGGCIQENEPLCGLLAVGCGSSDFTNGGCNFVPNRFTSVSCGDTICGTYGNCNNLARDTDWFTTVETSVRLGTWCCIGERPMNVGQLNLGGNTGTCPLTASSFLAVGTGVTGCRTALMYPGVFGWFAGLQTFTGVPCGADYQCTLTCACPAPCVDPVVSSAPSVPLMGSNDRLR